MAGADEAGPVTAPIRCYVVDVRGPVGAARYRVTDTRIGPHEAVFTARAKYCIDNKQVGLGRLDEVTGSVVEESVVDRHAHHPVTLIDAT